MGFLLVAVAQASSGHLFADATLLYEVLLKTVQQPTHHIIELVNKRDSDVTEGLRRAFLDVLGIVLWTVVALAIFLYLLGAGVIYGPLFQMASTQVILVV